jgi:predicted component of type VI protein secretion system
MDTSATASDATLGGVGALSVPVALSAGTRDEPPPEEAAAQWFLEIRHGPPSAATTYYLAEGTYTVGRGEGCEIRLEDATVSRRHAVIIVTAGRVTITDLGSANGTFVGEAPLTGEADGQSGMTLRFGEIVAVLVQRSAPVPSPQLHA